MAEQFCVTVVQYFFMLITLLLFFFITTGLLQADVGNIREAKQIFRLFLHESLRVFHDRLVSSEDKSSFYSILVELSAKFFAEVCFQLLPTQLNSIMQLTKSHKKLFFTQSLELPSM